MVALKARTAVTERDYPQGGTHMARLLGIVDLAHQPGYQYRGKDIESTWKLELTYELVNSRMKDDRPHVVSEDVKNNNYDKNGKLSNLMARVKALDPENFSGDGTDLNILLGKPCMVTVTIDAGGYPKVRGQAAVSGVPFGMEVPELENTPYTFAFFSDDEENPLEPDMDAWVKLSSFTQDKIRRALNFQGTELSKELALNDY